jgi:hypothetical protein
MSIISDSAATIATATIKELQQKIRFKFDCTARIKEDVLDAYSNTIEDNPWLAEHRDKLPVENIIIPVTTKQNRPAVSLMLFREIHKKPECLGSFYINTPLTETSRVTIEGSGLFFGFKFLDEAILKAESILLSNANLTCNPFNWTDITCQFTEKVVCAIKDNGLILNGMIDGLDYKCSMNSSSDVEQIVDGIKVFWDKYCRDFLYNIN